MMVYDYVRLPAEWAAAFPPAGTPAFSVDDMNFKALDAKEQRQFHAAAKRLADEGWMILGPTLREPVNGEREYLIEREVAGLN